MSLKNWSLQRDDDGLVWAILDCPEQSTNALSAEVMAELGTLLDQLDEHPPTALIFRSGKESGFIAGADIKEFSTLDTAEKAQALVARGWNLFNRLAAVRYPTLALIRGHCLGGGLELALACRYRIAVDEPGTRLGLPEAMLGIFPGWGGMLRLPRLAGPQAALDIMLTGKSVDAVRATKMGMVDECVPPRVMIAAARQRVLSAQAPGRATGMNAWTNHWPLKNIIAAQAHKQTEIKAPARYYPAHHAIIDLWARHEGNALDAPELLDRVVLSATTRNLVRVFHLQERLKSFGKDSDHPLRRVHVVGAGVMGADIAAWCALRGLTVTLQDQDMSRLSAAFKRLAPFFARRLRKPLQRRDVLDRLIPDVKGEGAATADVVIEAIFENLDAKRSLLRNLEARIKPEAVLATNTSSLRLEDLRVGLQRPERLVGIHFFNPVPAMPLVEVVETPGADPAMLRRAYAFVRAIDKLPLPVKSAPGFLVNAVLAPYMLEAMRCVDEGIAPETIDQSMRDYGMPLGPIELADTVGLDIAMAAGKQLAGAGTAPDCLVKHVEKGELGRKSGRGFYAYQNGKPVHNAAPAVPSGLSQRLLRPMVEQTRAIVAAGIVADADLADAGIIFGAGFAPFRGGPLTDADAWS
ncbi:MAG: enoyl-CoA hydratase/isomerase family protein [Proteobacteria bacterium]|nr:enoyl-CoA hydratase/isomerase family protein [Pseudomonadota bacterium]HQR04418.1 3-hydroxyacyl-CoA dehydrogenase NAD-binding domain-containing protein [Rhodocyclaceae bacterium]